MKNLILFLLCCPLITFAQLVDKTQMNRPSGIPSLGASPNTITGMTTVQGNQSTSSTSSVSGQFLTANCHVAAPTNFLVSLDNSTFTSSVDITESGGLITNVTVYFVISASASQGPVSGDATLSSTGATSIPIHLSGTVTSPTGFAHSITLSISDTVTNSDLTDFPFAFNITDATLKTTAQGGSVLNSNGYDINFFSDAGGTTKCKWWVEHYDPVAGNMVVYVKTSISHTTGAAVYMFYGKSGISTFQGGSKGDVWNSNFFQVFLMNETLTGASQTVADATANGRDATSVGTWTSAQQVSGPLYSALNFLNANGDYLSLGANATGTPASSTLECWVNITAADATSFVFGNSGTNENTNFFNSFYRVYSGVGDQAADVVATPTGAWTYLVYQRGTGTADAMYHNGVQSVTGTGGAQRTFNQIARFATSISANIKMANIRTSTVALSPDWIKLTYNNIGRNSTTFAQGSVQ